MKKLLCMLALAGLMGLGASIGAQDKKEEPKKEEKKDNGREEKLKALFGEFRKAVQGSKTQEEFEEKGKATSKELMPKVQELLKENDSDAAAIEACIFATLGLKSKDQVVQNALAKAAKTDKIKPFVGSVMQGSYPDAIPTLEVVLKDNPAKDIQGLAAYALAKQYSSMKDEKEKKKAEEYFSKIEKDFADVKMGRGTLGDMVKGELFELKNLQIGMVAPKVESKNLEGKKETLEQYKGNVIVIDIWATWCGPCKAMIPHEREMVEKFKNKPFKLISISADDEKSELEEFLKKEKMPWIHWWNEGSNNPMLKQWNIQFFPTIYVIDGKGVIRHKGLRDKKLEEAVEKLLDEVK